MSKVAIFQAEGESLNNNEPYIVIIKAFEELDTLPNVGKAKSVTFTKSGYSWLWRDVRLEQKVTHYDFETFCKNTIIQELSKNSKNIKVTTLSRNY